MDSPEVFGDTEPDDTTDWHYIKSNLTAMSDESVARFPNGHRCRSLTVLDERDHVEYGQRYEGTV
jgi:hypothetical protein